MAIGIDTGGTYTDGVLIDIDKKEMLKTAKTPTTHEDLRICIDRLLTDLHPNKGGDIALLSLSTTLATNACVEKKFRRCGLILFGSTDKDLQAYGRSVGLDTAPDTFFAKGGLDMSGNLCEEPDWPEFERHMMQWQKGFDCFAIVSKWGMKNTILEMTAKKILFDLCDKPIVCGCELSSELNYLCRAVNAYLNAQLSPVFAEFMDSVKQSLARRGMYPQICIVRGDGTVMSEEYARQKPVQTLLSGPAASVLGAVALLPAMQNAVVIDIGGTTSDVSIVENGAVRICETGARIDAFQTSTKAIDISTALLGGDTEIVADLKNGIHWGEGRVWPLSMMVGRYPAVKEYFAALDVDHGAHLMEDLVFYCLHKEPGAAAGLALNETEQGTIQLLKDCPQSLGALRKRFGHASVDLGLGYLETNGYVRKSALTPTDIMHVRGDFISGDRATAEKAVRFYADRCGYDEESFCAMIYEMIARKLYKLAVKKLITAEPSLFAIADSADIDRLLDFSAGKSNRYLHLKFNSDFSLVGIGAPAGIFIPRVADYFDVSCLVPPNAQVGNAVGAILGEILAKYEVEIRGSSQPYEVSCVSGEKIEGCTTLTDAEAVASKAARTGVLKEFYKRGGVHPVVTVEKKNLEAIPFVSSLQSVFCATARCSILDMIS
ncbi:hydantoinase/oxoprolinase [Desulfosarcina ovata subsp. sediminis]|uniref:Hydantoinase/oxoprolinase n=1 Tax=Desulfosarcina ovata subsp. sediminis TaxID=885957 RepID=A0A5K7ZI78_9BACT|nr:hydantoinase/oxoprolinase family protein [Desulfosarcina ovata]BBO81908.1 hydantoinase/oxoprolinase [Desulfosarcina ovata subsp. sediminis]